MTEYLDMRGTVMKFRFKIVCETRDGKEVMFNASTETDSSESQVRRVIIDRVNENGHRVKKILKV